MSTNDPKKRAALDALLKPPLAWSRGCCREVVSYMRYVVVATMNDSGDWLGIASLLHKQDELMFLQFELKHLACQVVFTFCFFFVFLCVCSCVRFRNVEVSIFLLLFTFRHGHSPQATACT